MPQVVLVANGHVVAGGALKGTDEIAVESRCSGVGQDFDDGVSLSITACNVERRVGRVVVLNQYLTDGIGLLQQCVELCSQVSFTVVCAQHY